MISDICLSFSRSPGKRAWLAESGGRLPDSASWNDDASHKRVVDAELVEAIRDRSHGADFRLRHGGLSNV